MVKPFKVSGKTSCSSLAGAVSERMKESGFVSLQAIGAGALNQAVKAIIIARGHLSPLGIDIVCQPSFVNLEIEGKERTGIKILVEHKISGFKYEKIVVTTT